MGKNRSSPLSFLFSWLSPLIIKFVIVENGFEVQFYKDNHLLAEGHPEQLRRFLPPPLLQWIEAEHIYAGPRPYPVVRQLWQQLTPLASKKLIIDASMLAELEEISPPPDFALVWSIDYNPGCIVGRYQGADRYLGMGWFQRGTRVWPLKNALPVAMEAQLRNLRLPVEQADFLLNSVIPYLRQYLPTSADFRLVTDFDVHVVATDVQSEQLTLALEGKDSQLLPVLQLPRQSVDMLLANHAIIRFSYKALTPALLQLLQKIPTATSPTSSITIQGSAIPQFIREQLPVLRRSHLISQEMAEKITRAYPIISIATLRPVSTITHRYEEGVGCYTLTATYSYQQYTLDMDALLAARPQGQQFVQQYGFWFEWPADSQRLVEAISQAQLAQVLQPEEVMGFDTQRLALGQNPPIVDAIRPGGTSPADRARSLFKQLRHHGVPGVIVGEPAGMASLFIEACTEIMGANWRASILWLVPSAKKGSITRALHKAAVGSHVTVASLVTLRDEPALLSRWWTLVIFQELDGLLDGSPQSSMLVQLKRRWALASLASPQASRSPIMNVLHLPDQYYQQFHARFLFDVEKSSEARKSPGRATGNRGVADASAAPPSPSAPARPAARATASPSPMNGVPRPAPERVAAARTRVEKPSVRPELHLSPQAAPANSKPETVAQPASYHIDLDQEKIASLQEESDQLQERLGFGADTQPSLPSIPVPVPLPAAQMAKFTSEAVPVMRVTDMASGAAPAGDEDWQPVLQQWKPEHWEIITCLYQGQVDRLVAVGRRVHRPVSQLIDEVNAPVDEHLGDLLIDAETQTIFSHLHETAGRLVQWYASSKKDGGLS